MKPHLLAGALFVLAGAAACNSSHEPPVPAPVVRQPPGDRADGPRKPARAPADAERTDAEKPDARKASDNASDRTAEGRRQARATDRDTAKRVTLLWFLLRSPLGG